MNIDDEKYPDIKQNEHYGNIQKGDTVHKGEVNIKKRQKNPKGSTHKDNKSYAFERGFLLFTMVFQICPSLMLYIENSSCQKEIDDQ